ncbi:MAG: hypothetical protein WAM14_05675 [Candidatus Nitrosopolaris sp.]
MIKTWTSGNCRINRNTCCQNGQANSSSNEYWYLVIHFKKLFPVMAYQECQTAVGRNIVEIVDVLKL